MIWTKPNNWNHFLNVYRSAQPSLLLAGCWFAVAATILLNKITFAGSDTRGNNYEWWRVTRVHQPGCLVVHDIDEIPIIDCPLQGIYPIGRWLNTRLPFYTQQFVPAWRGGGSGARDCIIILARLLFTSGGWLASWGGNISIPRGVSSFGYWLPFIMEYNGSLGLGV